MPWWFTAADNDERRREHAKHRRAPRRVAIAKDHVGVCRGSRAQEPALVCGREGIEQCRHRLLEGDAPRRVFSPRWLSAARECRRRRRRCRQPATTDDSHLRC